MPIVGGIKEHRHEIFGDFWICFLDCKLFRLKKIRLKIQTFCLSLFSLEKGVYFLTYLLNNLAEL